MMFDIGMGVPWARPLPPNKHQLAPLVIGVCVKCRKTIWGFDTVFRKIRTTTKRRIRGARDLEVRDLEEVKVRGHTR